MLRFQIRNIILTPATAVSILGLYVFMLISIYPSPVADLMYNYQYATLIGYGSFFIPVATVIPICFFLHHGGSQKGANFLLIRSSLSRYTSITVLNTLISGMVVTVSAFLLFTLTCLLYSPMGTPYIGLGLLEKKNTTYFYYQFYDRPGLIYLIMGMIYTVNGAMWPMISLFCYSFTANQYIIIAVPFIVKSLVAFIAQSFNWYYLDPGQLMLLGGVSSYLPGGGLPYMFFYISLVSLICGGVWIMCTYRKVHHV